MQPASQRLAGTITARDTLGSRARQVPWRPRGAQQDTAVPAHPCALRTRGDMSWQTIAWVSLSFLPPPMALWAIHIYVTECLAGDLASDSISTAGFPGIAELRCFDRSAFLGVSGCLLECNAPLQSYFQCKHFEGNVAPPGCRGTSATGDHTLPSSIPENP